MKLDFRDKSAFLQERRMRPATSSGGQHTDAASLDRNVQSPKIIHAAPLLLYREMCGCNLVTPRGFLTRVPKGRPYQGRPAQSGRQYRHPPCRGPRQPIWSPSDATQQYVRNWGRSGRARLALETTLMTPNRPSSVGSYLGPSLPSCFLISGLSYKTTFNSELRISSFPLYSI
jgi:hypothetical protein